MLAATAPPVDDDKIPCVPYVPFRCPACGNNKPRTKGVRGRIRYHRCQTCDLEYKSMELGPESVKDWTGGHGPPTPRDAGTAAAAAGETIGSRACRVQTSARPRMLTNGSHPPAHRGGRSTPRERREMAAANELLADDVADAARVLRGWRVRLAAVRTEKRLDHDAEPLAEDLELLERAVRGTRGACSGLDDAAGQLSISP